MHDAARDSAPALVLINPAAAGGRAARAAPAFEQWLQQFARQESQPGAVQGGTQGLTQGLDGRPAPQLHIPPSPEATEQLLLQAPPGSRVVLVGGDGTVHRALPALVARGHSLGLVPWGSGNDTARALGLLGRPWPQALAWALTAPARSLDLGQCSAQAQSWYFISSLAGGFDACVGLRALHGPRWLRGLPKYLWATLAELLHLQCHPMQIRLDGGPWHQGPCLFVSVLNTATYGGGMPAVPHAQPHDGLLDAIIAGHLSRGATALLLPRLLAARHLSHPQVHQQSLSTLSVECEVPVALAGDGEPLIRTDHWQVQACPAALQVAY